MYINNVKRTYIILYDVSVQYLQPVKNKNIYAVSGRHKKNRNINIYALSARHCGPHSSSIKKRFSIGLIGCFIVPSTWPLPARVHCHLSSLSPLSLPLLQAAHDTPWRESTGSLYHVYQKTRRCSPINIILCRAAPALQLLLHVGRESFFLEALSASCQSRATQCHRSHSYCHQTSLPRGSYI